MSRKATIFLARAFVFVVMHCAESGQAQTAQVRNSDLRTVSDGVYTAAQAMRGRAQYEVGCQSCHGADLSGANARPLAGVDFIRNWSGVKLDSLLDRARAMPPGAESSLGDDTYLDIVSYVLEMNGFAAGTEELKIEMLGDILIEGKDGPQPVANFALAQVVGCLTRGPDNTWVVIHASEPVRTRDPEASKDEELKDAEVTPLGTQTFQLLYAYPDPAPYEGHKVEAKGFLIKGPDDSINVTALQSLASICER